MGELADDFLNEVVDPYWDAPAFSEKPMTQVEQLEKELRQVIDRFHAQNRAMEEQEALDIVSEALYMISDGVNARLSELEGHEDE